MKLQQLFLEAESKLFNGYSNSRLVEFVFNEANNDIQAEFILNKLLS